MRLRSNILDDSSPLACKTAVFGVVQRRESGKVRAFVVPSTKKATLHRKIQENVLKGAILYTDAWTGYRKLDRQFIHHVINHSIEYVNGHIHTNRIESFWALLKRMIKGTQPTLLPNIFSGTSRSKCSGSTLAT